MDQSSKSFAQRSNDLTYSESHVDIVASINSNVALASGFSDVPRQIDDGIDGLLSTAIEHGIPYEFLKVASEKPISTSSNMELRDSNYLGFKAGGGYSGMVIRHHLEKDVGNVTKGTTVALKRYISSPEQGKNTMQAETTIYETARHELKALCHPMLRAHENICDIYFIAWADDSPYPILALELATYGSLEDILTAPGMGPTWLQKMNITIDVTLGLAAVHQSGLVHGDIKPSNIIIQHHGDKRRQIVAKLIDFAGAGVQVAGPENNDFDRPPEMGTELWWAPEIYVQQRRVDWVAAEVYTYGLVIASLWARPEVWSSKRRRSACLLDKFLLPGLESSVRRNRLFVMKSQTDLHPQSVMQRSWTKEASVNPIMIMALGATPTQRPKMSHLANLILPKLCQLVSRQLPQVHRPWQVPSKDTNEPEHQEFFTTETQYFSADPWLQKVTYDHWRRSSRPIYDLLARFELEYPQYSLFHPVGDGFALGNIREDNVVEMIGVHANDEKMRHPAVQAYQIALSNMTKVDTSCDEALVADSLYAAALGLYPPAIFQAPLISLQQSSSSPSFVQRFRPYLLMLGSMFGSGFSLRELKRCYKDVYTSTIHSLRKNRNRINKGSWVKGEDRNLDITTKIFQPAEKDPESFSLVKALQSHNTDMARRLLIDGVDGSTVDDDGLGLFHYLTALEDEDAASLASLCFEHGASLTQQACPRWYYQGFLPCYTVDASTPLSWAVHNGMKHYFTELLRLHTHHEIIIPDYGQLVLYCSLMHCHDALRELLDLKVEHPEVISPNWPSAHILRQQELEEIQGEIPTSKISEGEVPSLESCLSRCLGHYQDPIVQVGRRIHYGPQSKEEARRMTLQVLLDFGVQAFTPKLLEDLITRDDHQCLRMILQSLDPQDFFQCIEPQLELAKLDSVAMRRLLRQFELSDLLKCCTIRPERDKGDESPRAGSIKCFEEILSHFPHLAKWGKNEWWLVEQLQQYDTSPELRGEVGAIKSVMSRLLERRNKYSVNSLFSTNLCVAAEDKDPRFVQLLLKLGADVEPEGSTTLPPLWFALTHVNLDVADVLYKNMTVEQHRAIDQEHQVDHCTMGGRLIDLWCKTHDLKLLNVLDWLKRIGAHRFSRNGTRSWALLFISGMKNLTRPEHDLFDVRLIRELFQRYPEQLTERDSQGFQPLHLAAMCGKLEALKALLDMGAEINNISCRHSQKTQQPQLLTHLGVDLDNEVAATSADLGLGGQTPLDVAFSMLEQPMLHLDSEDSGGRGAPDLQHRKQALLSVIEHLISRGAQLGGGVSEMRPIQRLVALKEVHRKLPDREQFLLSMDYMDPMWAEVPTGEPAEGSWPRRLEGDRTSRSDEEIKFMREWARVYCPSTCRVEVVSRRILLTQQTSGLPDIEEYFDWLKETASLRSRTWQRTGRPSNVTKEPFLSPWLSRHNYGMRPHGTDPDAEDLPTISKLLCVGSPLSTASKHETDMAHYLTIMSLNLTENAAVATLFTSQPDPEELDHFSQLGYAMMHALPETGVFYLVLHPIYVEIEDSNKVVLDHDNLFRYGKIGM